MRLVAARKGAWLIGRPRVRRSSLAPIRGGDDGAKRFDKRRVAEALTGPIVGLHPQPGMQRLIREQVYDSLRARTPIDAHAALRHNGVHEVPCLAFTDHILEPAPR